MKKAARIILVVLLLVMVLPSSVFAAGGERSYLFELTVDGSDVKEVKTGDIITVVFRLRRTDSTDSYTMFGMQNEICYDSTFFELVEDSVVLRNGIVSKDIAMVDQYREVYMNYLSMTGGDQWEAEELVGSMQLKVIATNGVTTISNQDYLVSLQDGTGNYLCQASDITIILSTDCIVSFRSNGGTEIPDQTGIYGEKIVRPEDPKREGFCFEGWYKDIHLTEAWDFEKDVLEGNISLYAKWATADTADLGNDGACEGCCIWWIAASLLFLLLLLLLVLRKKRKGEEETLEP